MPRAVEEVCGQVQDIEGFVQHFLKMRAIKTLVGEDAASPDALSIRGSD